MQELVLLDLAHLGEQGGHSPANVARPLFPFSGRRRTNVAMKVLLPQLVGAFVASFALAQGSLTPPGAPAPLGRTLTQLEPRIDVATLTGDATAAFVITTAGSYYLSANINVPSARSGLAIAGPNVTVDLNGFSIIGAAGSLRGVEIRDGAFTVSVTGGNIVTMGGAGVGAPGSNFNNVHLRDLGIRACGGGGIVFPGVAGSSVENCRIASCTGGGGIDLAGLGLVSHSVVDNLFSSLAVNLVGIRGGVVSHCRVSGLNCTGSSAQGVVGNDVSHCSVFNIAGAAGNTHGISAPNVGNCHVLIVSNSSTGPVLGISSSGKVADCSVFQVGQVNTGTPTGISGVVVTNCRVGSVGNTGSTGGVIGIVGFNGTVSQCTVSSVTSGATFLQGIVCTNVSNSHVQLAVGGATVTGISATTVDHCSVDDLNQSGGTLALVGISAQRISHSHAANLAGAASNTTIGISGYSVATNCTVSAIAQGSGTNPFCFQPGSNGDTLNCQASNTGGVGINGGGGVSIRGCRIQLGNSGSGIVCAGTRNRVEDNTISNCTTGIDGNAASSSGLIVRNRITDCTTNITALSAWQVGPIVAAADPVDATSPWANFTD